MSLIDSILPAPPPTKGEYDRHKHVWRLVPKAPTRNFQFLWGEQSLVIRTHGPMDNALQAIPAVEPAHGGHYEFCVLANAVRRQSGKNDRPVSDLGLLRVWLAKRMHGFKLGNVHITKLPRREIGKHERGCAYPVLFHGTVTVEDEATAKKTWSAGIGRMRAFGYGLLLLVPTDQPNPLS